MPLYSEDEVTFEQPRQEPFWRVLLEDREIATIEEQGPMRFVMVYGEGYEQEMAFDTFDDARTFVFDNAGDIEDGSI